MTRSHRPAWAALLLAVVTAAGGCSDPPAASAGGFDSDNPAAKLYAIEQAGRARDRAAIPRLVEQLDHDDPAVRMMAILALERITGTRLGYNPYQPPAQRRPAIEAWSQAVREGRWP